MRETIIPDRLHREIEEAIVLYRNSRLREIATNSTNSAGVPLAIKYISTQWAHTYQAPGQALKISTTPGFTWGTGTYVTPLAYPISAAIYGRVGVIARFDPTDWRIFDATDSHSQGLYLSWAQLQPGYRLLTLTMHSQIANQFLRNLFRTVFSIDCVLFHPDQLNGVYTKPTDIWMAVTDWTSASEIATAYSSRFSQARFTVLVEEEFTPVSYDLGRACRIGPLPGPTATDAKLRAEFASGYDCGKIVRLTA